MPKLGDTVVLRNGFTGRVWCVNGTTQTFLLRQEHANGHVVLSKWTSPEGIKSQK